MSKILDNIKYNQMEYYKFDGPSYHGDYVELRDDNTGDIICLPVMNMFAAMVLAMKETNYSGTLSIIHDRQLMQSGREHVCFNIYALDKTGFVRRVVCESSYVVPGECKRA